MDIYVFENFSILWQSLKILHIVLMFAALIDLSKRNPNISWKSNLYPTLISVWGQVILIMIGFIVGPIIYLAFLRKQKVNSA